MRKIVQYCVLPLVIAGASLYACFLYGRYGPPETPRSCGGGISARSCETVRDEGRRERDERAGSRKTERSLLYWFLEEPIDLGKS